MGLVPGHLPDQARHSTVRLRAAPLAVWRPDEVVPGGGNTTPPLARGHHGTTKDPYILKDMTPHINTRPANTSPHRKVNPNKTMSANVFFFFFF